MATGKTLITDIAVAVRNQESNTAINKVILSYLVEESLDVSLIDWRIENYTQLRTWGYPAVERFTTARSKVETGDFYFDADLREEGKNELNQYYADYLRTAHKFPSENVNSGSNNYTDWHISTNTVTQQVGGVTGFSTGNSQDEIYVSGKWIDNRSYDISGSVADDVQYISFTDIPGFYQVTFSGDGVKHKTFNVAKKGEKTLYAVATFTSIPVDAHRKLIARATWQQN